MTTLDKEQVKAQIRAAFAHVQYPGDWCLRGSNEGDEPFLLDKAFKGKDNWQSLDPEFIDLAPNGFASALSLFSDEAFHFYLPAYLIADLDGLLTHSDPLFHLTHGLYNSSRQVLINPRRYGQRTWFDEKCHRFAMFNREEASAIVAYLTFKRDLDEYHRRHIDQALTNYWNARAN